MTRDDVTPHHRLHEHSSFLEPSPRLLPSNLSRLEETKIQPFNQIKQLEL